MKKLNQNGFMLVETLICATFIVGILTFVYIEFSNINQSYNDSFKYNNVNSLYLANQARQYLKEQNLLNESLLSDANSCKEINFCPNNDPYCTTLKSKLKINKVLYTKYVEPDVSKVTISDDFKEFVRKVKLADATNYNIYIEFTDGTYAVLEDI